MFLIEVPKSIRLVTIEQARERTGVSRRTIYNWISANKVDWCRTAGRTIRIVEDSLFSREDTSIKENKE